MAACLVQSSTAARQYGSLSRSPLCEATVAATFLKDRAAWLTVCPSAGQELYDEAKALKGAIGRLEELGAQIAKLEERKRQAVAGEDYDTASPPPPPPNAHALR